MLTSFVCLFQTFGTNDLHKLLRHRFATSLKLLAKNFLMKNGIVLRQVFAYALKPLFLDHYFQRSQEILNISILFVLYSTTLLIASKRLSKSTLINLHRAIFVRFWHVSRLHTSFRKSSIRMLKSESNFGIKVLWITNRTYLHSIRRSI